MKPSHKIIKLFLLILLCITVNNLYAVGSFNLDQVKLLDGPFKHAQDVNLKVLLQYDVDRLLAPFLKEAGLTPKAESYPNWIGLDGHIGGHYLSALSMYVAATGDKECQHRLDYMLFELHQCQIANGNGYVGGVPNSKEIFAALAAGDPKATLKGWVPWYNLHKTYAGLRDAWIYTKNPLARKMLIDFADWCDNELKGFTLDQMETMMDQEYGGMNEVLVDVSEITGNKKYLDLAKRFSHRQLLVPMSRGRDSLDNKHANTQVPKAIGFQRIAELSDSKVYNDAAHFFWQTVTNNRTVAFGGNSRREHFPAASACFEMIEEREGPESCNTYNMLKLTEGLFRMGPDAKYSDYYERALFNHILSTQHPEHGGYVYFTPARPRHYRVYSAPNQGMWCCVGSGMENHGKYGAFIYSHDEDTLYLNLFIASELNWQQKGVKVVQQTRFPDESKTTLTIKAEKPVQFKLLVRHPGWVPQGKLSFKQGQRTWTSDSQPSSYVQIDRTWSDGDTLEISMPMHTTVEQMPNVSNYYAIMHGPIVLAAKTGTEDLKGLVADDQRWSHIAHGRLMSLTDAPMLVGDLSSVPSKVTPIANSSEMKFKINDLIKPDAYKNLVLEPFFRIHDSRYMMYWEVESPKDYENMIKEARLKEQQKLTLDRQTIDLVIPGEQQPESDHFMKEQHSFAGIYRDKHFRHVFSPGWFSYDMKVNSSDKLQLIVTYWGNETPPRVFEILIDGKKLINENLVAKWNKEEFVQVKYPIPAAMIKGKKKVTVTFKPFPDNYAGGIYGVRIIDEAK